MHITHMCGVYSCWKKYLAIVIQSGLKLLECRGSFNFLNIEDYRFMPQHQAFKIFQWIFYRMDILYKIIVRLFCVSENSSIKIPSKVGFIFHFLYHKFTLKLEFLYIMCFVLHFKKLPGKCYMCFLSSCRELNSCNIMPCLTFSNDSI